MIYGQLITDAVNKSGLGTPVAKEGTQFNANWAENLNELNTEKRVDQSKARSVQSENCVTPHEILSQRGIDVPSFCLLCLLLGCVFGFIAGYSAVCDAFLFSMQLLPSLYSNEENYVVVAREKQNIDWSLSPSVIYYISLFI